MVDPAQVEARTELTKARGIEINRNLGGLQVQTADDLEKVALRLARGMVAVPIHCRDQPGVVYALCLQALEWGMPIMSVINKSYVPRNGDRIGFESQLIHAVIEKNAPIKSRLRYEIIGEGDERRCKVWATFHGEATPHEYTSDTLAKMHPGHVTKDAGKFVKGSPLWDSNPEVQMFYSASRQWARLFCPDVLLGAYTPEEMENAAPMLDVTPKVDGLAQRLRDAKAAHSADRGFDVDHVAREASMRTSIIEGEANTGDAEQEASDGGQGHQDEPEGGGRHDPVGDRADSDPQQSGSAGDAGAAAEAGAGVAGDDTKGSGQEEIFPPDRKPVKPKPARKR